MKPFDLKAALRGEPVSANGNTYVFSKFDEKDRILPLCFTPTDDSLYTFWCNLDGVNGEDGVQAEMAAKKTKKTVFLNIYGDEDGGLDRTWTIYYTAADAKREARGESELLAVAAPVEIEVEE